MRDKKLNNYLTDEGLLQRLDNLRREIDFNGQLEGVDEFRQLAYEMLSSSEAATAFDITQESDDLRDKYGRNVWGQSCLLARRLAESGVPVINIYCNTPKNGQEYTNWDDHRGMHNVPGILQGICVSDYRTLMNVCRR